MVKKALKISVSLFVLLAAMSFYSHSLWAIDTAAQAKAIEEKALERLQAQEWIVYVTPSSGRGVAETDVITFTADGKISSRNLLAQGYADTNFRVSVVGDGAIIWETMKVKEEKDLAFLRGELRGEMMTGGITLKLRTGKSEDYIFSTTQPSAAPVEELAPTRRRR